MNNPNNNGNNKGSSTLDSISKEIEDRDEQRKLQQLRNKEIHQQTQIDLSNSNNITKCINEINQLEKEIENELQQIDLSTSSKDSTTTPLTIDSIKNTFNDIEHKIATMSLLLAESNHFLPLFEIKNLNLTISNVQKNTNTLKDKVIPKQKFSFKRAAKSSTPKVTNNTTIDTSIPSPAVAPLVDNESIFDNSNIKGFNGKELVYPPTATTSTSSSSDTINDLLISNLVDCKVILKMKVLTACKINNIKNCTIISHSPIDGSIFIDNCIDTTFSFSSRQIRIHYSSNCRFNIFVKSNPIIEGCNGIKFSSYPHRQLQLTDQDYSRFMQYNFDLININADTEKYKDVNDFDWLQTKPSPHWELVKEEQE
ncbi:hypothetical protein CYY_003910 [Polysphondylium violaceum]|uniref:C-CAP/cofactor C-like domain-containing protein n=1 Tax=Polysphondylium violaceum TaxID=133409 RepID=A0A8J4PXR1_9MYCE|nr:hypothetical protein CYY_003910 [Polysphondylium violaceum]